MARDLGIVRIKGAGKKADTHFTITQKVQEPQPGPVGQSREKKFRIKCFIPAHEKYSTTGQLRLDIIIIQVYPRTWNTIMRDRNCYYRERRHAHDYFD